MGWDADQLRTLLPGLPQHLAGTDAELFGNVVFSQHDAVAGLLVSSHRHWLVPQRGIVQDLHAGIEIVHV